MTGWSGHAFMFLLRVNELYAGSIYTVTSLDLNVKECEDRLLIKLTFYFLQYLVAKNVYL